MSFIKKVSDRITAAPTDQNLLNKKELKSFLKTVDTKIKASKFGHYDIDIDELRNGDLRLTVGDLVTDKDTLDNFLDFMSDMFWEMKEKKTYKTITPNWWGKDWPEEDDGEYTITLEPTE